VQPIKYKQLLRTIRTLLAEDVVREQGAQAR